MVRQLAQTRLLQLRTAMAAQREEILRLERQTELLSSDTVTEEEMDRILAEVILSEIIDCSVLDRIRMDPHFVWRAGSGSASRIFDAGVQN